MLMIVPTKITTGNGFNVQNAQDFRNAFIVIMFSVAVEEADKLEKFFCP